MASISFTAWSSSIARDTFLGNGVTKSTSAIGISIRAHLLFALEVIGVAIFIREACSPNIIRVTVGGNTFSSAFNTIVVQLGIYRCVGLARVGDRAAHADVVDTVVRTALSISDSGAWRYSGVTASLVLAHGVLVTNLVKSAIGVDGQRSTLVQSTVGVNLTCVASSTHVSGTVTSDALLVGGVTEQRSAIAISGTRFDFTEPSGSITSLVISACGIISA